MVQKWLQKNAAAQTMITHSIYFPVPYVNEFAFAARNRILSIRGLTVY
jgi:hypothetical protein